MKQIIYSDFRGGTNIYWVNTEEGKWFLTKNSVDKMILGGHYQLVTLSR